jgi:hypothetical protein
VKEGLLFFQCYILEGLVSVGGSGMKQNYENVC